MFHYRTFIAGITFFTLAILSGCGSFATKGSASEPLNSMLETTKDSRQSTTRAPLSFPASVAIIFIPSKHQDVPATTLRLAGDQLKQQLLAQTKYIRSVAVVAVEDAKTKIDLSKIRAMYDADIAIILSYQQDQQSQQSGPGGLVDATIVGAFLVPSVKTMTSTLIDGKIVHIDSDALMFRTSGIDSRSTHSTSYGRDAAFSQQSIKGILAATEDLGNTLTTTLTQFDHYDLSQAVSMSALTVADTEAAVADGSHDDQWRKVNNFKFSGGGGIDILSLVLIACAWTARVLFGNSKPAV